MAETGIDSCLEGCTVAASVASGDGLAELSESNQDVERLLKLLSWFRLMSE